MYEKFWHLHHFFSFRWGDMTQWSCFLVGFDVLFSISPHFHHSNGPKIFVWSTFVVVYLHAKNFWPGPFALGDMTFQSCQKQAKIEHFVISPKLMLKKWCEHSSQRDGTCIKRKIILQRKNVLAKLPKIMTVMTIFCRRKKKNLLKKSVFLIDLSEIRQLFEGAAIKLCWNFVVNYWAGKLLVTQVLFWANLFLKKSYLFFLPMPNYL